MPTTLFKVRFEVWELTGDPDTSTIKTISRVFPIDHLMDEKFHTVNTYELLETMRDLRESVKGQLP